MTRLARRSWLGMLVALVTGLALAAALAACGSDSADTDASPTDGATTNTKSVEIAGVTIQADQKLHDALPDAIKEAGVLRVATNMPYPPWEFYTDEEGNEEPVDGGDVPAGLDHDLALAIATKLGLDMSFDQTAFDAIIPTLLANKADTMMAGMFDTEIRRESLDFVDYAKDSFGLCVAKGNPENIVTIDDLAGKTVAVQSSTTADTDLTKLSEEFVKEGKQPIKLLRFAGDSEAFLALQSGKADARLTSASVGGYAVKVYGGGDAFELVFDPSIVEAFGEGGIVGAGVPKTVPELRDAMQVAVQALMDDGAYEKIIGKWGLDSCAIDVATVNEGDTK